MNKKIKNYLKNKFVIGGIAILLIAVFIFSIGKNGDSIETAIAQKGSITETVSVTGKVAPFEKADLGFESGGVVSKINVKVGDSVEEGDIIATLENSGNYASYEGAQANLMAEQARLSELQKGLRPEELSVEEVKVNTAKISYENARTGLINGMHDAYVKTEDALTNYADTFFDYPNSVLPRININVGNTNKKNRVNDLRASVERDMNKWKEYLDSTTVSTDPSLELASIQAYILNIKNFLSLLSEIVSDLSSSSSGLSQSEIEAHTSTINSSLSVFNTAVGSLATAEANYKNSLSSYSLAEEQYLLQKAGSSPEAIQTQEAKVAQARASVLSAQAELSKKIIRSPISGIISRAEPQLGEFVSAGEIVFGVIGGKAYKVEINVPEVDIVKISIGDKALINLDAYDVGVVFEGTVISIDPAETIIEGIPTYEVTLQFDTEDERVRSGLTANIDIVTESKEDVIILPFRAVIRKDGNDYVRLLDVSSGKYSEVPVKIGTRGSDGMIEIISGISTGDTVVTLVK